MKLSRVFRFSLEDISLEEMRLLLRVVRQYPNNLSTSEREMLDRFAESLEEELLRLGQICEGCSSLDAREVQRKPCPATKELAFLCQDCFEARSKHVKG